MKDLFQFTVYLAIFLDEFPFRNIIILRNFGLHDDHQHLCNSSEEMPLFRRKSRPTQFCVRGVFSGINELLLDDIGFAQCQKQVQIS
eukprot:08012.XXX_349342_349602_1 [CDS] Oithona nana genome sequencing.